MTDAKCNGVGQRSEGSRVNRRQMKVSYVSRYQDYVRIPALFIKGQWLKAAGFTTGTEVDVRVMEGCLVLTARELTPDESYLEKTLKKVRKMSDGQQRQVEEMIRVIGSE